MSVAGGSSDRRRTWYWPLLGASVVKTWGELLQMSDYEETFCHNDYGYFKFACIYTRAACLNLKKVLLNIDLEM